MSTARRRAAAPAARPDPGPPYVGALLRLCLERVRARMHAAIREAGFAEFQAAHFVVFSYPPPDGVRPSDLARRTGMSRQAANHVIAQMESLGFLERRAPARGARRLVYITARGWKIADAIYASLRAIEAEWAAEIGDRRFDDFKAILRRFAGIEPPPPAALAQRRRLR